MANLSQEFSRALVQGGPELGGSVLRQLLDAAINGVGKVPGAKLTAAKALVKHRDAEKAIDALATTHVSLATAQGFLTNLGGLPAMAVGLPANIAAISVVQIRLVAAIAHLRGYDVDNARVRSAMTLCLMGRDGVERAVKAQELPTVPMAIATAPVFDASLERQIAEKVFGELLARIGGRRAAVIAARRVPLLGGGVSGALDAWSTHDIGTYAREQFPRRRPITH